MDLTNLLREASNELADTTTSLMGQIHSLMNSTVQADRDLTAINVEALHLQEQTQADPLTGVLNRHGLQQAGQARLAALRSSGGSVAVIFVDLDDFKQVNDRLGHAAGDEVLKHVGGVLGKVLGSSAIVARYGGDEFVAIVDGLGSQEAQQRIASLTYAVKVNAPQADDKDIDIGLSIGALWRPNVPAEATLDDFVQAADALMYRSKTTGKGSVSFDSPV